MVLCNQLLASLDVSLYWLCKGHFFPPKLNSIFSLLNCNGSERSIILNAEHSQVKENFRLQYFVALKQILFHGDSLLAFQSYCKSTLCFSLFIQLHLC